MATLLDELLSIVYDFALSSHRISGEVKEPVYCNFNIGSSSLFTRDGWKILLNQWIYAVAYVKTREKKERSPFTFSLTITDQGATFEKTTSVNVRGHFIR